ncbi:aKG-HExxH-type peptide beta-hydroxylase [Rhizobium esperanzae]|uniref:HEXXH motif domain-containing protein n=1 Tax=Rhizobium esperanzae TaxID=1967781 RepID=A0A7W6R4T3_9HYPH|nr:HEXXH motif-containing putative peptide modification protein [Rhizobium esperanzae]MBB4236227.1 hypothetical protein [Rhizobium esperanzae]
MLSLCEPKQAFGNLYRLARVQDPSVSIITAEDLRRGYLAFLEGRQPSVPVNYSDDIFVVDQAIQDKLAGAFSKGALNDLNQEDVVGENYPLQLLGQRTQLVQEALAYLLTLNDDFSSVFDIVIHSIFVRPSKPTKTTHGSHGGSSSASIGAIWLAVGEQIQQVDLVEMLVHELTHHLMFIDELNQPQFDYDLITRKENFALSAILKRQRPLDKVIHSIAVGASIIDARNRYLPSHGKTLVHPATPELKSDTLAAIASVMQLQNIKELVTRHTIQLLEECEEFCHATSLVA